MDYSKSGNAKNPKGTPKFDAQNPRVGNGDAVADPGGAGRFTLKQALKDGIGVDAQIEDARGLANVNAIAAAPRVQALVLGPADLMASLNMRTLVVGDFNTPYDSVAFDPWRYQWFHGLSQSSRTPGAATWPIGLPLLSIDHVWLSKDLWPRQAWKETVLGFDHAWQVIEFSPFLP